MPRGPRTYFRAQQSSVRLHWGLIEERGFRRAQLGAAGAMLSHFSRSERPAQIVLPTGVGKTALLTLAPFLVPSRRVLVVAPGRLVRDQLADAWLALPDLRSRGVLPEDIPPPSVATVNRRMSSAEAWEEWRDRDVVVGTVHALSHGYPAVQRVPEGLFDLILFDEAHHLPATAWTAILNAVSARSVLFTGTPFRRDGKRLPGDIAFRYPLRQAIDDGVFKPVRYVPVEVDAGDDPHRALAITARDRILSEEHRSADSRLLVRTGRVAHAEELVQLYESLGVPLGLVVSSTSARAARRTLDRVRSGELLGFACVGALVEGFDFPSLKIAAYHEPHRTLAPTLQFIGRLARVRPGPDAELLALRTDVEDETRQLYREDTAWEQLLPDIVDAAVEAEFSAREYVHEAAVQGPLDIPPLAISPPRSAHIFRTDGLVINLDVAPLKLAEMPIVRRFFDADSSLVAFITRRRHRPRWLRTDALDVALHELHLAVWSQEHDALFISTDSPAVLRDLRKHLDAQATRRIGAAELSRLLRAAEVSGYHSVGTRATRLGQAGQASYRMLAGPAVQGAVRPTDAQGSVLGHVMGRQGGSGEHGTFGFSVAKAKLWEPEAASTLLDFRQWCEDRAAALDSEEPVERSAPGLEAIPLGDRYASFPELPLAAVLHPALFAEDFRLLRGQSALVWGSLEVLVRRIDDEGLELTAAHEEDPLFQVVQTPSGTFELVDMSEGLVVIDRSTAEVVEVDVLMEHLPPSVYFADGSMVFGSLYVGPRAGLGQLPPEIIGVLDWSRVDIRTEYGAGRDGMMSIQDATASFLTNRSAFVITDHGSGELADFVAVQELPDGVRVDLVHCKASGSATKGRRLSDLYDLLGQAVRSARWAVAGDVLWSELGQRLVGRAACRVIHGEARSVTERVEQWAGEPPRMEFLVWAVQPGIARHQIAEWTEGRSLLLNTYVWCQEQGAGFQLLSDE